MESLRDVYLNLVEQEKVAAQAGSEPAAGVDEQAKLAMEQAYEYDQVGRALAHQVFYDLAKEASAHLPVGHGSGQRHEDGMPCHPGCKEHGKGVQHGEKRAALQQAILAKMAADPEYVAALVAKHQ